MMKAYFDAEINQISSKGTQLKSVDEVFQAPVIPWEIVQKCSFCSPNSKRCYLCKNEKLEIATY